MRSGRYRGTLTTRLPPGLSTRTSSAPTARGSRTCSSTSEQITRSKDAVRQRQAQMSAAARCQCRRRVPPGVVQPQPVGRCPDVLADVHPDHRRPREAVGRADVAAGAAADIQDPARLRASAPAQADQSRR